MKKIISIMLALVMLLSFAACNKDKGPSKPLETVSLDGENLKLEWRNGEFSFPNGKKAKLPCSVNKFIEDSGLKIPNADDLGEKTLKAGESITLNIVGSDMTLKVKAKNNSGKDGLNYMDATIIRCSFNNTQPNNRQIKIAGTLTAGVTRKDLEKALGVPQGQESGEELYYYNAVNTNMKHVRLTIGFNSDDIVNSVAYEIVK